MKFQTEEAKENEQSLSVALLCAGLLRRVMVCELKQVLLEYDGFLWSISVTYNDKQAILYVLALTGSQCVTLNVWLC